MAVMGKGTLQEDIKQAEADVVKHFKWLLLLCILLNLTLKLDCRSFSDVEAWINLLLTLHSYTTSVSEKKKKKHKRFRRTFYVFGSVLDSLY